MKRVSDTTNSPQMSSAAYRLAAFDQDFLLSDGMRGVRFLLEFAKAEQSLRAWGVRSTLVVFGSARAREDGPGEERRWYAEAREFGRIASLLGGACGIDHKERWNVVATGGGPGLMEAANRGASEAGAPSIGFNISLPHEQAPNAFTTPELTFQFHYFAMRKMHFAMRASALVVFPGGFGTLDELFEVLTLRQTGKSPAIPIVLIDEEYWRSVISFQSLLKHRMIEPTDLDLFTFADTAAEAWAYLERQGVAEPHPSATPRTEPAADDSANANAPQNATRSTARPIGAPPALAP